MTVNITKKKKEDLQKLGLTSLEDILNYFPYRYEFVDFVEEIDWTIGSKVVFEATIISKPKISYFSGRKNVIYFEVATSNNQYYLSIFNRNWLLPQLKIGVKCSIFGKYEGSCKVLVSQLNFLPLDQQLGIRPVHSLKDLLTEKYFDNLLRNILNDKSVSIEDFVPDFYRDKYGYITKREALSEIHFPTSKAGLLAAKNYLKYEEFLKFNLIMQARKKDNIIISEGFAKKIDYKKVNYFVNNLPFDLTNDQLKAVNEILDDMSSNKQMVRLLQGDVGCGKTAVAFIAMYALAAIGKQSAMMAPTAILARQHYENLKKFFKNYDIGVGCLFAAQSAKERATTLKGIEDGSIKLIVGTHSLFQDSVNFYDLGLIITDEQHRFGVKQRESFLLKGNSPDVLAMSATPIPRTLATSLYGDIDVSTILETPNKGKTIHTTLIEINSFIPKLDEIENLLNQGNQMYVICSSIEESSIGTKNVSTIYSNLQKHFNGRHTVGLLHGKMDDEKKKIVQTAFSNGEIDILVATTVVEVGVDVKNANIMVIYDANRFGLSQLHQLRGRVGRGIKEGYCYLLTSSTDEESLNKLRIIENNSNGFTISQYDLQLRGPGDLMGYRQSGLPDFVLGNVVDDADILYKSLNDAKEIIKDLSLYPLIKKFINENNEKERIIA